jgi:putative addiction module component (TIGR02574 family)
MTLTDLPQVEALSVREKLELVDAIWKNVSTSPEWMHVTQEEKDMLDARWADFLRDPGSALSVEAFKAKIHALRA